MMDDLKKPCTYSPLVAVEGEEPLDSFVADGGFCGIFRRFGCIGDSLSSGEFESMTPEGQVGYHDLFDFSWGQYLARLAGSAALNFSRGGMTAAELWMRFGDQCGVWQQENVCPAYIMALGVNDFNHPPAGGIGTADDILPGVADKPDTFVGYFCRIVERLRQMEPKCRIFLVTMPRKGDASDAKFAARHTELMYAIAKAYEFCYVIDLYRYGPTYDAEFYRNFFLSGHMNPAGYLLTARMFASYIDYIIRHNPEDFKQVGFIGTGFYNANFKW